MNPFVCLVAHFDSKGNLPLQSYSWNGLALLFNQTVVADILEQKFVFVVLRLRRGRIVRLAARCFSKNIFADDGIKKWAGVNSPEIQRRINQWTGRGHDIGKNSL
jgi:hypothetical protein